MIAWTLLTINGFYRSRFQHLSEISGTFPITSRSSESVCSYRSIACNVLLNFKRIAERIISKALSRLTSVSCEVHSQSRDKLRNSQINDFRDRIIELNKSVSPWRRRISAHEGRNQVMLMPWGPRERAWAIVIPLLKSNWFFLHGPYTDVIVPVTIFLQEWTLWAPL